MRVGVYVDAFNLYYGGRAHFGAGAAGWRWLDVRALAARLVATVSGWPTAHVDRVVYCTARINAGENPTGARDQDVYLKALLATRSADHIEFGYYTSKVKKRPLARADRKGSTGLPLRSAPARARRPQGQAGAGQPG